MKPLSRRVLVGLLGALYVTHGSGRFGHAATSPVNTLPLVPLGSSARSPPPVPTTSGSSGYPESTGAPGSLGSPAVNPLVTDQPDANPPATNGMEFAATSLAASQLSDLSTPTGQPSDPNAMVGNDSLSASTVGEVTRTVSLNYTVANNLDDKLGDWVVENIIDLQEPFRVSKGSLSSLRLCSIGDALVGKTICINSKGVQQLQGNTTEQAVVGVSRKNGTKREVVFGDESSSKYWSINETAGTLVFDADEDSATRFHIYRNRNKQVESLIVAADGKDGPYFLSASSRDKEDVRLSRHITTNSLFTAGVTPDGSNAEMIDAMDQFILNSRRAALANQEQSPFWISYDLALAMPLKIDKITLLSNPLSGFDVSQLLRKSFKLIVDLWRSHTDYTEYKSLGKDFAFQFDLASLVAAMKVKDPGAWRVGFGMLDMPGHADRQSILDLMNDIGRGANDTNDENALSAFGLDANAITISLVSKAVLSATKFSELTSNKKKPLFFDPKQDNMTTLLQDYYDSSCGLAAATSENLSLAQKIELVELPCNHSSGSSSECERALIEPTDPSKPEYWYSQLLLHYLDPKDEVASVTRLGLLKLLPDDFVNTKGVFTDPLAAGVYQKIDNVVNVNGINLGMLYTDFIDDKTRQLIDVAETFCAGRNLHIDLCAIPTILRQISVTQSMSRNVSDPNQITNISGSASMDFPTYYSIWKKNQEDDQFKRNLDTVTQSIKDFSYNSSASALEQVTNGTASMNCIDKATFNSIVKGFNKIRTESSALDAQQQNGVIKQKMKTLDDNLQIIADNRDAFGQTLRDLASKAQIMTIAEAIVSCISAACSTVSALSSLKSTKSSGVEKSDQEEGASEAEVATTVIGSVKDVVGQVQRAVQIEGFVDYVKTSIDEMTTLFNKMNEALPKLTEITNALRPLEGNISLSDLQSKSQALLQVIGNYRFPIREEEMESLQLRIRTIGERLCEMIDVVEPNCVKLAGLHEKMFGGLMDAVQTNQQLLDAASQYATATIQARTASTLQEFLDGNSTETTKPKENATKSNARLNDEDMRLRRYWLSLSKLALIQNQLTLYSSAVQYCDQRTYLAGGVVDQACRTNVYEASEFNSETTFKIFDFTQTQAGDEQNMTFAIPTANSSAFLDLRKLMSGGRTYFQFPMNDPNWYPTYQIEGVAYDPSDAYFVKQIRVMLPPLSMTPSSSSVTIAVKSAATANVGNGKSFQIPTLTFMNEYKLRGTAEPSEEKCWLSRYPCQTLQYCYQSYGTMNEEMKLAPSLHSVWEFSVNPSNGPNSTTSTPSDQLIEYGKAITNVPIYVDISTIRVARQSRRLQVTSGTNTTAPLPPQSRGPDSRESNQLPGSNTGSAMGSTQASSNTCCLSERKEYYSDKIKQCAVCPNKSKSVMGLFCVLDENASELASLNSTSVLPTGNSTSTPTAIPSNGTGVPVVLPDGPTINTRSPRSTPPPSSTALAAPSGGSMTPSSATRTTTSTPEPVVSASNEPQTASGVLPSGAQGAGVRRRT